MIGVILAAGVGSRLRPMTNNKPKCLVTTAGKPILQYQLDTYKEAGITDLVIIVGYEGQAIRDYCKHNKDFNITIVENEIYEDTNNMYSLYLAKDYVLGKSFVLNNADLSVDSSLVRKMLADPREDLVAVDVGLFNDESMKVALNEKNKIIDISKQVKQNVAYGCSIDFYKFSKKSSTIFFDEISQIVETDKNLKDWTEVAMQRLFLSQALQFEAFDIQKLLWVEIDNYDDLALSDSIFSQKNKKIDSYSTYCFDLDGTIYVGNEHIHGAAETVNRLMEIGKNVFYISNNSSKNKADYCNRLLKFGIKAVESQVVLSSDATIRYLQKNEVKKVFVLGTNSFKKSILDAGIDLCSHTPEFVVVGYDTELSYVKLVDACRLINKGIDFIATHCDPVCPSEDGPIPDIGVLIKMLEETTGKKVFKTFGKPNKEIIETLIETEYLDKDKVLMIGDRLYTDIQMAKNSGVDSLLVLTGDTSRDEVESQPNMPTYILNSISDILNN
jgi:HAD superfamily hydrolase (TIGR01457 family)